LAGKPAWAVPAGQPFERPEPLSPNATADQTAQFKIKQAEFKEKLDQWQSDNAIAAQNSALGAVTALLLGLVGSVIGGWMASGEPMTLTYHRTRSATQPFGRIVGG
jgi:hypothetical protein